MGNKITLTLEPRELHGKKVQNLRDQGILPAIIYGPGIDPISVQAPQNVLEKVWKDAGKHSPVHITVDGKRKIAMIKDADVDPVKGELRHISFHAVNQKNPVVAEIPIHLLGVGESDVERAGLVVLQSIERIEVRALPMDLPEALEISLDSLKEAGDRLVLGDITLPENVEFVEHTTGHQNDDEDDDDVEAPKLTDLTVATVYEPSALQAANEASGGDAEDESEVEAENGAEDETQSTDGDKKAEDKSESKESNGDAKK